MWTLIDVTLRAWPMYIHTRYWTILMFKSHAGNLVVTFPLWILGHLCVQSDLWPSAAATTVSSNAVWRKRLIRSFHLLFITFASPAPLLHGFCCVCVGRPFFPPACATTVHPRGHEAGHAEVKVPISPELGPLSHLFLQNCGKSAGHRRTTRLILFQNLMRLLDSVTKRDLNAELAPAALLDRLRCSCVQRLSGVEWIRHLKTCAERLHAQANSSSDFKK